MKQVNNALHSDAPRSLRSLGAGERGRYPAMAFPFSEQLRSAERISRLVCSSPFLAALFSGWRTAPCSPTKPGRLTPPAS